MIRNKPQKAVHSQDPPTLLFNLPFAKKKNMTGKKKRFKKD